jgi:hypothetical protein
MFSLNWDLFWEVNVLIIQCECPLKNCTLICYWYGAYVSSELCFFVDQNIGKFLLELCGRESELWVVAEAVDTIIDVFGEDETDSAALHINLVQKLQALLSSLKHKVRLVYA